MTMSNIKVILHCDICKVWKVVLDVGHYNIWRSDLSKAEMINENQFVEYTHKGYPTMFTVTLVEKLKCWEFDMENSNMKGHWIGVFTSKGNETELGFTEYVTAKKFYMKPFLKSFLKKQQMQFVTDLKKALDLFV